MLSRFQKLHGKYCKLKVLKLSSLRNLHITSQNQNPILHSHSVTINQIEFCKLCTSINNVYNMLTSNTSHGNVDDSGPGQTDAATLKIIGAEASAIFSEIFHKEYCVLY